MRPGWDTDKARDQKRNVIAATVETNITMTKLWRPDPRSSVPRLVGDDPFCWVDIVAGTDSHAGLAVGRKTNGKVQEAADEGKKAYRNSQSQKGDGDLSGVGPSFRAIKHGLTKVTDRGSQPIFCSISRVVSGLTLHAEL